MKHTKSGMLLATGAALALSLSACSTGSGASGSSGSSASSDELSIGVGIPSGNETYWTGFQAGAQEAADELGVAVTFTDAKNDAQTMNDQVNTMIVSGVDGIAVAPVDTEANSAVAQAATDAGIPLITSNRSLAASYGGADGANPRVHTGFDDVAIGREQGDLVAQACEGIDPCRVIQEVGTLGSSAQIDRQKGMEETVSEHENIVIVDTQANNFDPTRAIDLTQSLLQAHPDVDVITTQEDPSALAVVKVLQEQGLAESVKTIGVGGSTEGAQAVADGTLFGSVQVSSHEDGAVAVETIVALINGEDLEITDIADVPTVVVPSLVLTEENAGDNPGDW